MPPLRQPSLLEVNEFLVLDYIRDHGQTTRPRIASDLGLSSASISRIVKRLLSGGLVTESIGEASLPGRPASLISFNSSLGALIAIDLGGTKCHGALADLSGVILNEVIRPTGSAGDPYATLLSTITALRDEAEGREMPVSAAAIGVPAVLDPDSGLAKAGPNVDWTAFPLFSSLERDLDIPFTVENDLNLAALAHAWKGQGQSIANFATVSIGTGIGAAIVANGRLVRGRHNAAGEVGYLVLDRRQLHEDSYHSNGRRLGALEVFAAGPSIARRARELLEARPDSSTMRNGEVTTAAVLAAAQSGDAVARLVLDEVIDYVAMAIIAIVSTVDPDRVILEGGVGRALRPHLGEIAQRVAARVPAPPELLVSGLESNATLLGAIAAALELARQRSVPSALFDAFGISAGVHRG